MVPRKKGRGCFATGCLVVLAVLLLGGAAVAAFYLRIPQQLGLVPSADRLLAGTPDRAAAAAILDEMTQAGIDTTGLSLYVLPVEGQSGTLEYVVLDTSAGFSFPSATAGDAENPFYRMLMRLAASPTIDDAQVEQIAMEYRDESSQRLATFTARTSVIRDFAAGRIDEQAFSDQLAGSVDPGALLSSGPSDGAQETP
jgi:hypothetical protein